MFPFGKNLSFMLSESKLENAESESDSFSAPGSPDDAPLDPPVSFFKSFAVTKPNQGKNKA